MHTVILFESGILFTVKFRIRYLSLFWVNIDRTFSYNGNLNYLINMYESNYTQRVPEHCTVENVFIWI
jgi:hypothetical protein